MRDQEIIGLYEAYQQVHSQLQEVEQLDEEAPERITKPSNRNKSRKMLPGYPARLHNPKPTKMDEEAVENWVNSLIEEGYDLSDYTWEEMYEAYANLNEEGLPYGPVGKGFKKIPAGKKRKAMMDRQKNLTKQAMQDDGDGGNGSPRGKMGKIDDALRNPRLSEDFDLFDTILEHLVAEGYADTNKSALVIMANMSEEWRESIVEVLDTPERANEYGKKVVKSMLGAATKAVITKDKEHLKTIDKRIKGAKMAKRKAERKVAEES